LSIYLQQSIFAVCEFTDKGWLDRMRAASNHMEHLGSTFSAERPNKERRGQERREIKRKYFLLHVVQNVAELNRGLIRVIGSKFTMRAWRGVERLRGLKGLYTLSWLSGLMLHLPVFTIILGPGSHP